MADYKANEEQIRYAKNLVNTYSFGQRGRGGGTIFYSKAPLSEISQSRLFMAP